jgi:hypothetical protein
MHGSKKKVEFKVVRRIKVEMEKWKSEKDEYFLENYFDHLCEDFLYNKGERLREIDRDTDR